ncbi:MAG TPA: choice-of-anchor tandem repeat GloVer-containing protein [Terriglobales bacterium]|nr:choice-of-anchor tandem repeat GloVer-containing protein [Terriglobales bacterium]
MLRKPYIFASLIALALAPAASAQWNEEVLYSFQGIPDGIGPIGRIVYDKQGNLYGATIDGGAVNCYGPGQCGTVYKLSPPSKYGDPWTETVLHVFQGLQAGDGATPEGGLVMDAVGNLYGTTGYDGTGQCTLFGAVIGCGTVYEMSPPSQPGGAWTEAVIYSFQGGKDGYVPSGDLVFDQAGNLYGVTLWGGGRGTTCDGLYGGNCGTVFELSPPKQKGGAWTEKVLYSFAGTGSWSLVGDGGQPNGGLVFDDQGNLYGTTQFGGHTGGVCRGGPGCGIVFELVAPRQNGGQWTEKLLHAFQGQPNDGGGPFGDLVLADGALYGATNGGGTYENGTVFQLLPTNNGVWAENLLHIFTGGPGNYSFSPLVYGSDGTLYGASGGGDVGNGGAIYQLQPPAQQGGLWTYSVNYTFPPLGSGNAYDPDILEVSGQGMIGSSLGGGTGQACGEGGCGTVFGIKP